MWLELPTYSFIVCTFRVLLEAGAVAGKAEPSVTFPSPMCVGGSLTPLTSSQQGDRVWASLFFQIISVPLGPSLFSVNFRISLSSSHFQFCTDLQMELGKSHIIRVPVSTHLLFLLFTSAGPLGSRLV